MTLGVASCAGARPAPRAVDFAALPDGSNASGAPRPRAYAAVHVDHLKDGGLHPFTEARLRWLSVLAAHDTTDGRGLFLQTGEGGFLSLRPLAAIADLDRQRELTRAALAAVPTRDQEAYDAASDGLLVPPHRNEIWQFDPALSLGVDDPTGAIAAAAWGKMTIEEIDPTPAGDDYRKAWQSVRDALEAARYPLRRVSYWSRYGSGDLVSFWLARTQAEFLASASVEDTVAKTLGEGAAADLFARMRKVVRASDGVDVIPRPDLSSRPF
jgi:hypothetical protein